VGHTVTICKGAGSRMIFLGGLEIADLCFRLYKRLWVKNGKEMLVCISISLP